MKLILPVLGIILSCLFFFSCQREIHGDIAQAVVENGGTVLSKYIELDTTLASGQDTISVYTFSYDNLKRIKRIYQVKNFPGFNTYYITTDFFYNGSESLPFKTIELDHEAITYVDTSFYTYSNGFVRSDSSVNYIVNNGELLFTDVVSFSVTGNNVFVNLSEATPVSGYQDTATLTITRQGGNITTQLDPDNTITYSKQLQYDNNVNPFYNADIHYPIIYEHLINSFSAQKNNMTDGIDFTKLSGTKSHVRYVYTYRGDGYPLEVRKIDLLSPGENRKGLFLYTK